MYHLNRLVMHKGAYLQQKKIYIIIIHIKISLIIKYIKLVLEDNYQPMV